MKQKIKCWLGLHQFVMIRLSSKHMHLKECCECKKQVLTRIVS